MGLVNQQPKEVSGKYKDRMGEPILVSSKLMFFRRIELVFDISEKLVRWCNWQHVVRFHNLPGVVNAKGALQVRVLS